MFRNNAAGEPLVAIPIPTKMQQNLLLLIDNEKGAQFIQAEMTESGGHKMQEAFKTVGEVLKTSAEILLEVMKHIPAA